MLVCAGHWGANQGNFRIVNFLTCRAALGMQSERVSWERVVLCVLSLEPGPSRARYFPRDMLLLTTTARERAWRLLKITGPVIGWLDGGSPILGVSPWLAPLSCCTLYIVEVQRTSEQLFLRLRNSNSQMSSTIAASASIAKVWSVKSCMLYKDNSRFETAMKATMRDEFDASGFGANLKCCLFFFCLWGPVNFFFESHVVSRSNRGPSGNSGWVHRNWRPFEKICWAQTTKLGHGGGFRKREHKACSPAWSPDSRWSEMLRAPGRKPTPGQRCKWRLVFVCVCTVTRVSIQMRKRGKILKIMGRIHDTVL